MPPVAIAVSTPCAPSVAKPCELKLAEWNSVTRKATTTSVMTPSFHQTATLLMAGEPADAEVVDEDEERHAGDGDRVAERRQRVHGLAVAPCVLGEGAYFVAYCRAPSTSIGATAAARSS